MMEKPIFVATHPRACSTAFERVFMTRKDLQCIHEPFGDAFYFGPERLSKRYEGDEKARLESGFAESTYKTVFDSIAKENVEGKRLFIKDIAHYLLPPNKNSASPAPSLMSAGQENNYNTKRANGHANGAAESNNRTNGHVNGDLSGKPSTKQSIQNPCVVPQDLLRKFHFTFLIRHPKSSIPSYYRCTIPPLDKVTGFYDFMPSEAGYSELRRFFDYLRQTQIVGPAVANKTCQSDKSQNGTNGIAKNGTHGFEPSESLQNQVEICLVDADDLLDNPSGIIEAYCKSVGIQYTPEMLKWNTDEEQCNAKNAFEKWTGFHEDAIHSTELKARTHKKEPKTDEQLFQEWTEKYGEKGARMIRDTVDANVADYEYLKQFALRA